MKTREEAVSRSIVNRNRGPLETGGKNHNHQVGKNGNYSYKLPIPIDILPSPLKVGPKILTTRHLKNIIFSKFRRWVLQITKKMFLQETIFHESVTHKLQIILKNIT